MTADDPPVASVRRHLTIAFCDLSDSTRIAATMEPELYAELLQQLRDLCEDIVGRHGGTIVRIDGDGVAFILGHPVPYEDAGRRATEAAIDLRHAVAALDQRRAPLAAPIRLHTGIHSGLVLVRSGDLVRGRFEMLGDATNLAARLRDAARPGEIVVSEATLGADIAFFQSGPRETLVLKGRRQPLPAYRVVGREPIATRFVARGRRGFTHFVGRVDELDRLTHWLEGTGVRGSSVAAIIGAPGIGKTRLAREFLELAAAQGGVVHRGYCEAYLGARPFQPFLQLVQSLLRDRPDIDAPSQIPPRAETLAAHLIELLGRSRTTAPILLYIDDWQWADDASRSLFDILAAQPDLPLRLLLSARDVDPLLLGRDIMRIDLSPFAAQESHAAVAALLPAPEPFLIQRITDWAGGSPLFIEELCHALASSAAPITTFDGNAWLDNLIQVRFAALPEQAAALVRTASVIGHMIPTWLFEALTGIPPGAPEMHRLASEDFIFESDVPGMLRFKHGITRDAIYRTVGLDQRQALHARVVDALQARVGTIDEDEVLEALAYHCGAAGQREQAADYAELAGDKALAIAALDRAQAQYRAAIDAVTALGDTLTLRRRASVLARKFGQACVVDPSREQLPVLEQARARAVHGGDPSAIAWSEYWLGFILYGLGESRQAIGHLDAAVTAAELACDERLLLTIRATQGQALATACDYEAALVVLDDVVTAKRRHRVAHKPAIILSYSLACRAMVYADQGRFDAAYADLDEAMEVLAGVEHEMTASVLTLRCAAYIWQGRYREAIDLAVHSRGVAERARARYIFVNCTSLAGYPRWCLERDPAMLAQIVEATGWLELTARQQFSSLNFGWLAEAMVSLHRYDEARHFAARAFARARKGDRLGEAMAARAMAMAAQRGHGVRSAGHYLALAHRSAARRGSAHEAAQNLLCADELALDQGRAEHGMAERLDEAHRAFKSMAMDGFAARAAAAMAHHAVPSGARESAAR